MTMFVVTIVLDYEWDFPSFLEYKLSCFYVAHAQFLYS